MIIDCQQYYLDTLSQVGQLFLAKELYLDNYDDHFSVLGND
jgi:hypothetical protein